MSGPGWLGAVWAACWCCSWRDSFDLGCLALLSDIFLGFVVLFYYQKGVFYFVSFEDFRGFGGR